MVVGGRGSGEQRAGSGGGGRCTSRKRVCRLPAGRRSLALARCATEGDATASACLGGVFGAIPGPAAHAGESGERKWSVPGRACARARAPPTFSLNLSLLFHSLLSFQTPSALNLSFTPAGRHTIAPSKPSLAMPGAATPGAESAPVAFGPGPPQPRSLARAAFAPRGVRPGAAAAAEPLAPLLLAPKLQPGGEPCLAESWLMTAAALEEGGGRAGEEPPPSPPRPPAPAPAPQPRARPQHPASPTTAALRAQLAALRARGPLSTLPATDVALFLDLKLALVAAARTAPSACKQPLGPPHLTPGRVGQTQAAGGPARRRGP